MLPLKRFKLPKSQGEFGAVRKHDIHTGIDLYCNPGIPVFAIEAGIVVRTGPFTGVAANSPWWNDTQYVIIKGESGYILYGEIENIPETGTIIEEGSTIGNVVTVLKVNKGLPMTMLHLELYDDDIEPVIWNPGELKPLNLLDPTFILTKELWKYYNKSHKSYEMINLPEGEWFNISGRGQVMTLDLRKLDPSIRVKVGDNVGIGGIPYIVKGVEYPGHQNVYVGLLLKEIVEEDHE